MSRRQFHDETKSIRFRAVCKDGDFVGIWTSEEDEARQDASQHKRGNPDHEVRIEFEQSGSFLHNDED